MPSGTEIAALASQTASLPLFPSLFPRSMSSSAVVTSSDRAVNETWTNGTFSNANTMIAATTVLPGDGRLNYSSSVLTRIPSQDESSSAACSNADNNTSASTSISEVLTSGPTTSNASGMHNTINPSIMNGLNVSSTTDAMIWPTAGRYASTDQPHSSPKSVIGTGSPNLSLSGLSSTGQAKLSTNGTRSSLCSASCNPHSNTVASSFLTHFNKNASYPSGTYYHASQASGFWGSNKYGTAASGTIFPHPSNSSFPRPYNASQNASSCGGVTVNIPDATLNWWYTTDFDFAVATFSVIYNKNDSLAGWTLASATTTFNVTSALAEPTYSISESVNTALNQTVDYYYNYTAPSLVYAETTVVTQVATAPLNISEGTGPIPSNLMVTPAPASTVLPGPASAALTALTNTPFVYFTEYAIDKMTPTRVSNGSVICSTSRRLYTLDAAFAIYYDAEDPSEQLEVNGDLPEAFLDELRPRNIPLARVKLGTYTAKPTLIVVVEEVYAAQAALALSITEVSAAGLATSAAGLGEVWDLVTFSAHTESSESSLMVPTTGNYVYSAMALAVHTESSASSLIVPTPILTSTKESQPQTTDSEPRESTPVVFIPYIAKVGNTELTFSAPATEGNFITTMVDGSPVTAQASTTTNLKAATALPVQQTSQDDAAVLGAILSAIGSGAVAQTPEEVTSNDGSAGSAGGVGGIASAIIYGLNAKSTEANGADVDTPSTALAMTTSDMSLLAQAPTPIVQQPGSNSGSKAPEVITIADQKVTQTPTAIFAIDGQTINAGQATTINGKSISVAPQGGLVIDGNTISVVVPDSPVTFTTAGEAVVISPIPAYVLAEGSTLLPGGPAITVDGTQYSLDAAASSVVIDGSVTSNVAHPTSSATMPLTVGGSTLLPGGPAITVGGTQYSLDAGASFVVIDGSVTSNVAHPTSSAMMALTVGSGIYTANAATQFLLGQDAILTPGGKVTVGGTTISLESGGSHAVINGVTETLTPPIITPGPMLRLDGTVYEANSGSTFDILGQKVTPGGLVVVDSSTTISLATDGSFAVINGVKQSLESITAKTQTFKPESMGFTATKTAAADITVDGQLITAQAGSEAKYLVSGQTLSRGGSIVFSGPNGVQTVSLSPDGSTVVENVSGAATTSALPSAFDTAQAAAPLVTIGSSIFTALPGPGPSYLLPDGQTLYPGGTSLTETIDGSVYIVSLSPSATVLAIEDVGTNGAVTHTEFETLFPAVVTGPGGTTAATTRLTNTRITGSSTTAPGASSSTSGDANESQGAATSDQQIGGTFVTGAVLIALLASLL